MFALKNIKKTDLHGLKREDMTYSLNIAPYFHIRSLETAIKLLKEEEMQPLCTISHNKDQNVHLWTANHVIEWLRLIHFEQYAPKLRGAGVHGALIVYAEEFCADVLADILGIPSTDTCSRIVLTTHFNKLLTHGSILGKWQKFQHAKAKQRTASALARMVNLFWKAQIDLEEGIREEKKAEECFEEVKPCYEEVKRRFDEAEESLVRAKKRVKMDTFVVDRRKLLSSETTIHRTEGRECTAVNPKKSMQTRGRHWTSFDSKG